MMKWTLKVFVNLTNNIQTVIKYVFRIWTLVSEHSMLLL